MFLKIISIYFFSVILFLNSCTSKDNIVSESDFIPLFSEVLIIKNLNIPEDQKLTLIQSELDKYHTNSDDFKKSIEYYKSNDQEWTEILEKVSNYIKKSKENKK